MDIGEGMQLQIAVTFLHYVVTKSFLTWIMTKS